MRVAATISLYSAMVSRGAGAGVGRIGAVSAGAGAGVGAGATVFFLHAPSTNDEDTSTIIAREARIMSRTP